MSGHSTYTLMQALTALAFSDPTPARLVPIAMEDGRWKCCPTAARARLRQAAQTLCYAGYRGDLKIWGKPITQSTDAAPNIGALKLLDQADCLQNRLFIHYRDALFSGSGSGDDFADTFEAEAGPGGFDYVCVDRNQLDRLLSASNHSTGKAERDCEVWLHRQFEADPTARKGKKAIAVDARKHFGQRLSGRGFDRAWARVAPLYGRTKAGRRKSNQNTK
ncbi:hypothetical protein [Croceicoccus mobilis]|uniref:Uncharacterized protein n=1 Tax=Croceicoccus mobilis TaxID=1703339 RepID=A0A916YV43_9SPHN|nr:hypothetical protein [Croceicoccus mobilis]GGD61694.1 hypothetical protein GCM10010990_08960 [Croceicoccus mobilis]